MRLFAALYPPAEVLDSALEAFGWLNPSGTSGPRPRVAWVPAELLHITLAFYGEVPEGVVTDLDAALADVARTANDMNLCLRGAGVFSDRVLWLGVGGDTHALRGLSAGVVRAGEAVGLRRDRRPRQRAHMTVARVSQAHRRGGPAGSATDRGAELIHRYAEALSVYAGPAWTAHELRLVSSDLTDRRPVHSVVERYLFGRENT